MQFDPNNSIIKLCADGMSLEGQGKKEEANNLFQQSWNEAANDFEKFTAAHYVARHQQTVEDKLKWDQTALEFAVKINDHGIKETYPSLYLNLARCYEDLNDFDNAKKNYELAVAFTGFLPDDGYGNMIKSGVANGISRVTK